MSSDYVLISTNSWINNNLCSIDGPLGVLFHSSGIIGYPSLLTDESR